MMAASIKKLISLRAAIVDALKSADITFVGDNVYSSRTMGGFPEEGDFIAIYTNRNTFDDGSRSPVIYKVTTDVIVDIVVQGNVYDEESDRDYLIDERMDIITDKVLEVLVHDSMSDNLYKNLGMKKVRVTTIENTLAGDGETDKGTQRISMTFEWYMVLPTGSDAEDEYLTTHTRLDASGATMEFDTEMRQQ